MQRWAKLFRWPHGELCQGQGSFIRCLQMVNPELPLVNLNWEPKAWSLPPNPRWGCVVVIRLLKVWTWPLLIYCSKLSEGGHRAGGSLVKSRCAGVEGGHPKTHLESQLLLMWSPRSHGYPWCKNFRDHVALWFSHWVLQRYFGGPGWVGRTQWAPRALNQFVPCDLWKET